MNSPFDMKSWDLYSSDIFATSKFILDKEEFTAAHRFLMPDPDSILHEFISLGTDLFYETKMRLPFPLLLLEYEAPRVYIERCLLACKQLPNGIIYFNVLTKDRNKNGWENLTKNQIQIGPKIGCYAVSESDKDNDDIMVSIKCLVSSILFLSVNSLSLQEVVIPTKLQKARDRSGKPPLYDFKVLKLKREEVRRSPSIGSHASPILHWRRGHYRKLFSDRIVHVNACLVGKPEYGFLEKAYDATELFK